MTDANKTPVPAPAPAVPKDITPEMAWAEIQAIKGQTAEIHAFVNEIKAAKEKAMPALQKSTLLKGFFSSFGIGADE